MANVLTPTSVSELQRSLFLRAVSHPNDRTQDLYAAIWREDVLQQAYLLCRARNTHAPGIDGKRLIDVATYGARKWLKELELDLQRHTYQPSPLLRVLSASRAHDSHALVIPTIRDEVCMTAAMIVVEPITAAWVAMSTQSAPTNDSLGPDDFDWKQTLERSAWHTVTPDASWNAYLTEVPHNALKLSLALRIVDRHVLDLFANWLACPIVDDSEAIHGRTHATEAADKRGISADLPISPLLMHLAAPKFLHTSKYHRAPPSSLAKSRGATTALDSKISPQHPVILPRPPVWSARRDKRLRYAVLISLILHALVISMQFGEPGYGIPLWGQQGNDEASTIPMVNVTLTPPQPPKLTPPVPPPLLIANTPPPSSKPIPVTKTKQKKRKVAKIKQPVPVAPVLASKQPKPITAIQSQVRPHTAPPETPPSAIPTTKEVRQKANAGSPVLMTSEESAWSKPLTTPTPTPNLDATEVAKPEPELVSVEKIVDPVRAPVQPEVSPQIDAEKEERAKQLIKMDRREAERRESEAQAAQERLEQAAAAKAAEAARAEAELEKQRRAKLVAAAAEAAKGQEAADVTQAAEKLARAEAERIRQAQVARTLAEQKAKQAQAEAEAQARALAERAAALAKQQREERARLETEKLKIAQAKAKEEELLRAETERLRQVEIQRAKEALEERLRNEAIAKREAENTQQAIEAKEAAERLAKQAQAEAESLARQRAAEAAAQSKKLETERSIAAEQASAAQAKIAQAAATQGPSTSTGSATGSSSSPTTGGPRELGAVQNLPSGRELAARALDSARNLPAGFLPIVPPEAQTPRRASILGRDPKDIQLAFYGDGWRQKVERIGAMNFPKLSKFLAYDPMVVTVSINSDGTLSGIRIVKSSGHIDLDNAVRRIIEISAPFAAFPPSLKRNFDVVDITRTWVFVGDRPQLSLD